MSTIFVTWSLRHKKELATIYQEVISKAEYLRDTGLMWTGGALEEASVDFFGWGSKIK